MQIPFSGILKVMEMDPHTLQQIIEKIEQQMRCPQCGKKVPIDFESVKVVAEEAMLLQLKCEGCNAYVVLQASLNGVEQISAPPYDENEMANASTGIQEDKGDVVQVRSALKDIDGSFKQFFDPKEEAEADTEIA